MKISVVVPAYNEEKYLPDCLAALNAQDYPRERYEITVVDNNSTDKTAIIAQNAGAKVIREGRQGYVFSLNRGMTEAGGEIIAVTDADTVVAKDWLSIIDSVFKDEKVVGITGSNDKSFNHKLLAPIITFIQHYLLKLTFALGKPHLTGFNFAVRNDAFRKIGGLDLKFEMSADVDLGMRIKEIGPVLYIPEMRVTTSPRRWKDNPLKALIEYTQGFVGAIFLRQPPNVKQKVIR